jgi:hypothetical protein
MASGLPLFPASRYKTSMKLRRFALPLAASMLLAGCAGSISDSENRIQAAAANITSMKQACVERGTADCGIYTPAVSTQFNDPVLGAIGSSRDRLQKEAALIEAQRDCLQRYQSDPSVNCSGYAASGGR